MTRQFTLGHLRAVPLKEDQRERKFAKRPLLNGWNNEDAEVLLVEDAMKSGIAFGIVPPKNTIMIDVDDAEWEQAFAAAIDKMPCKKHI